MKIEEGRPAFALHDARHGGPGAGVRAAGDGRGARGARSRCAREQSLPVAAIGLGSNLLVADDGFEALVLKLGGELAAGRRAGRAARSRRGRRANAVALHRARAAGLGGFEFACAIPGTAGGGVWMNAGAYGGDFARVLERALVVDGDGASG